MSDARLREIRARSDDSMVSIGFGDDWSDDARTRHVMTPSDATALLARRGPTWTRHYGEAMRCEAEQYEAARAIGVGPDDLRIRVRMHRARPPGRLNRIWYGTHPELLVRHRGPKLAIAAVYAAPHQPTEFDLNRLRDFGYDGVVDVAQRIARWNENGTQGLRLPMPMDA